MLGNGNNQSILLCVCCCIYSLLVKGKEEIHQHTLVLLYIGYYHVSSTSVLVRFNMHWRSVACVCVFYYTQTHIIHRLFVWTKAQQLDVCHIITVCKKRGYKTALSAKYWLLGCIIARWVNFINSTLNVHKYNAQGDSFKRGVYIIIIYYTYSSFFGCFWLYINCTHWYAFTFLTYIYVIKGKRSLCNAEENLVGDERICCLKPLK